MNRKASRISLRAFAIACVVAAAAGCQNLTAGTPADTRPHAGAENNSAGFGTIRFTVDWPKLKGYRAQIIPDSTARLDITVKQGSTTVATASVARPSGQSSTTTSVRVPADTGLDAMVDAYSASTGGTLIASGTQTNLTVVQSQDTAVSVTLAPDYVPAITNLNPSSGQVGDTVVISGSSFASPWTAQNPVVTFGAVQATITASSDTEITVTVPAGAADGNVTVSSDGMTSAGSAFDVTP